MSRKLSTRKRPERDRHMLKEQLKIEEGVFDQRTMAAIWKMFNHNIISRLDFMIAKGKEANVYVADSGSSIAGDQIILKIFRIETSSFDRRIDYVRGDIRFEGKEGRSPYEIVRTWCKKEYGNLMIARAAGLHSPIPYYFNGNVLAMEFIGDNGMPSRTLRESELENPDAVMAAILSDLKKLYAAGLVHGDVSEYNILMRSNVPCLIDFGQAVVLGHPNSGRFLERDVGNIISYFSKRYGIEKDPSAVLDWLRKGG